MASRTSKKQKSPLYSFIELVATIAVAVGLAFLIQAFVVKPYRIPSGSMEPTLNIGQRILVFRLSTHPGVGDIVVFHPPAGADPTPPVCGNPHRAAATRRRATRRPRSGRRQTFIKRVVGVPGDHLRISTATSTATASERRTPTSGPASRRTAALSRKRSSFRPGITT